MLSRMQYIGGCGLDLPKSGAAMAALAAPLPTPLLGLYSDTDQQIAAYTRGASQSSTQFYYSIKFIIIIMSEGSPPR